jgi:hypothetical protein
MNVLPGAGRERERERCIVKVASFESFVPTGIKYHHYKLEFGSLAN